jgi:hypothetical protein
VPPTNTLSAPAQHFLDGRVSLDRSPGAEKQFAEVNQKGTPMTTKRILMYGAALLTLCVPATFAQTSQTIQQRKVNQQDRIAQGVKSGQLTPGETTKLERQQKSINKEERNMRKADDGHLTAGDRKALNNRQNRASKNIYDKKHNAKVGH